MRRYNVYDEALERWMGLCRALGLSADYSQHVFHDPLWLCYQKPVRAYHSFYHVLDGWDLLEEPECLALLNDLSVAKMSWAWHDLEYSISSKSNERDSAGRARETMAEVLPVEALAIIEQGILATDHKSSPAVGVEILDEPPTDAAIIADIDLSILGRHWDEFLDYRRKIELEYVVFGGADPTVYRSGSMAFCEGLLGRETIFRTRYFWDRFEAQGRENLERYLEVLQCRSR